MTMATPASASPALPPEPALTAQERQALRSLLQAGLQARDALAAIQAAQAANQALPTDAELDADAQTPPDFGWWAANPAVPAELRRILDAAPATAP